MEVNDICYFNVNKTDPKDYILHYGVKGQKKGKRRYQNPDGSLTEEGKRHYGRIGLGIAAGATLAGLGGYALAKKLRMKRMKSINDTVSKSMDKMQNQWKETRKRSDKEFDEYMKRWEKQMDEHVEKMKKKYKDVMAAKAAEKAKSKVKLQKSVSQERSGQAYYRAKKNSRGPGVRDLSSFYKGQPKHYTSRSILGDKIQYTIGKDGNIQTKKQNSSLFNSFSPHKSSYRKERLNRLAAIARYNLDKKHKKSKKK